MTRLELIAGPDCWAFRADMKRREIRREQRREAMLHCHTVTRQREAVEA